MLWWTLPRSSRSGWQRGSFLSLAWWAVACILACSGCCLWLSWCADRISSLGPGRCRRTGEFDTAHTPSLCIPRSRMHYSNLYPISDNRHYPIGCHLLINIHNANGLIVGWRHMNKALWGFSVDYPCGRMFKASRCIPMVVGSNLGEDKFFPPFLLF